MNILKELVNQLNKEEIRVYKYYAERMRWDVSRKDLELFAHYKKSGHDVDDAELSKLMYGKAGMNAFSRLKNRLTEEIHKSLVIDNIEKNKSLQTYFLMCVYQYHLSKRNYKLAFNYLKKARKAANETEQYDILDTIYGEMIKISRELLELNPAELIEERGKNLERLNSLRKVDEILALLSYRLKRTQNIGEQGNNAGLFDEALQIFTGNADYSTPQFRLRIHKAISQLLIQSKDYPNLELWIKRNIALFEEEQVFSRHNPEAHPEMMVYLINALNAQKKYEEALTYSHTLYRLIQDAPVSIRSKFLYFYYQGLVASYQVLNRKKAIDTLLEMQHSPVLNTNDFYDMFIYTNLAILYFDEGKYSLSSKNLNKVYRNSYYEQTDSALKTALYALELLIRFEMDDWDLLEYRLGQIKKDIRKWGNLDTREAKTISLLDKIIKSKDPKQDKKLYKAVTQFVNETPYDASDMVDVNQWLKKKIGFK